MTVVYCAPYGFVTDFGDTPLVLTDSTGTETVTLPRYGVWKNVNGKAQVVLVTDNLDDAMAAADAERVR